MKKRLRGDVMVCITMQMQEFRKVIFAIEENRAIVRMLLITREIVEDFL